MPLSQLSQRGDQRGAVRAWLGADEDLGRQSCGGVRSQQL
jgi:hypothetical protein